MAQPKLVDLYFIDSSRSDLVMGLDRLLTAGDLGIKNVADMVTQCKSVCSKGAKIRELRVVGHGNASGQWFGEDWVDENTLASHQTKLAGLRPCFDAMSYVSLGGCKVGQAEILLSRFSKIVGVPVQAWTASQRPGVPGDEGANVRCFRYACERGDKVGFDYLDN